ncbi:MAG: aspartyl protease family protein [Rhizomicrobium sp.]
MRHSAGAALAAFFLVATAAQAGSPPVLAMPSAARRQVAPPGPVGPDVLFAQGEFAQARAGYEAVPKSSPNYEEALRQLGAIALYQNHLGEADAMLTEARARNPADTHAVELLAETLHRENKFSEMAQLLRQIGRPERAAEFELFGNAEPYRVVGRAGTATIGFLWTEPFPVVKARVNGVEGLFLIDTGAPEIILDPVYARDAHVQTTTPFQGAAPRKGMVAALFGRIAKFGLPGLETDDVPAMIISTRALSASARGAPVAGVIGTEFLSQFRPTLDYVRDRLILEPHDAPPRSGATIADIPFWFVGDHIFLAPGRLDKGPKQLFFINTGTSGYAFIAPESTLRDAGVPVPTPQAPSPQRAGPRIPSATFPVARLSLGTLTESNLTGLYGPFPPRLEMGLGVHVGGIVSHAFFHTYAVTFDFVRMTIGIRK